MREPLATFSISLAEFWESEEALLMTLDDPPQRLEPVVKLLKGVAERTAEAGETAEVGRFVWTREQCEVGVYLRRGRSVGAVLGVTWRRADPIACEVKVGPLSALSASAQWAAAVPSAVLGFLVARMLLPRSLLADGVPLLAAGLLLMAVFWVAIVALIIKTGLFMNVEASRAVAARLQRRLARKLERRAARAKG